ncbi:MAG: serine/threonine protein kinase [Deltaproteobacteria bacterium]|nr:MAG: serine/threonine protein kinase [Deltaproteobacteria bacterium]
MERIQPTDILPELETVWERRGVKATALVPGTDGTLARGTARGADGAEPVVDFDPDGVITLGPVLAEGGMGVVRLAEQPSLKREVAAKVLRPDRMIPEVVAGLWREAWVTGHLEHPNIVPVHLLERRDGAPILVMKRIEGTAWSELLADPEALAPLNDGDPFEWHLRVLATVCHAVHFAHSRGIVHLDLKPANVMVGRFGEVYLVDWGVAASLPGVGPSWLPPVDEIATVCGTPAYMSPEQASADRARLGAGSDVFGLGAILHELVTGSPPHHGADLRATLIDAYRNTQKRYGHEVPSDIVATLHRSMAREPAERFPTAEAFRRALEDFLSHRASTSLSEAAEQQLIALRARLALTSEARTVDPSVQHELMECQLGFRQALTIWSGNQQARGGLRAVLIEHIEQALALEQADRAVELLVELSPPEPRLTAAVAALEARQAEEAARVRSLERDADPNVFHRHRSVIAALAGLSWLVWNGVCGYLHRSGTLVFGFEELLGMNLITLGIFGAAAVVTRRTLLSTATNRRGLLLFGAGFLTTLLFWTCAHLAGVDPMVSLGLSEQIYVYFLFAIALVVDRRAAWGVVPLVPIAVLAALYPFWAFELAGLTGLITGAWLAILWRRPQPA